MGESERVGCAELVTPPPPAPPAEAGGEQIGAMSTEIDYYELLECERGADDSAR